MGRIAAVGDTRRGALRGRPAGDARDKAPLDSARRGPKFDLAKLDELKYGADPAHLAYAKRLAESGVKIRSDKPPVTEARPSPEFKTDTETSGTCCTAQRDVPGVVMVPEVLHRRHLRVGGRSAEEPGGLANNRGF